MQNNNILLETGTNELEVLEFLISGKSFGINVEKVKEIKMYEPVQKMPHSHDSIEGIIKPRGEVITVVDLPRYLGLGGSDDIERDVFIWTKFNKMNIAFHVHKVESIHRISWTDVEKPDVAIFGGNEGVITGIAQVKDSKVKGNKDKNIKDKETQTKNKIISIIDFEKIIADISPQSSIKLSEITDMGERPNNLKPVLLAEDSSLLRTLIIDALKTAGYTRLISCTHGKEAWEELCRLKSKLGENIKEEVACVITDIEMPQMDGHRLTKLIKDDLLLRRLPVIIFSSLIDDKMRIKGAEVGADAQLSKPEIGHLVTTIDKLIEESSR